MFVLHVTSCLRNACLTAQFCYPIHNKHILVSVYVCLCTFHHCCHYISTFSSQRAALASICFSLSCSPTFFPHCSYLLPHLLPYKPAMDIHCFRQRSNNTLQRLVKMSFVPAGFWERFIARMLISLKEMDLQVLAPSNSHHISSLSEQYFFTISIFYLVP